MENRTMEDIRKAIYIAENQFSREHGLDLIRKNGVAWLRSLVEELEQYQSVNKTEQAQAEKEVLT